MREYRVAKHRGKQAIVWYDDAGRRHRRSLGTPDAAEARAKARYFIELIEAGERPQDPTIGEIVEAYLGQSEAIGAPVQRFHWKAIQRVVGGFRVAELTESVCRSYAASRPRKPGTIRKELGLVRAALGWAKRKQWVAAVPYVWLPPAPPPRDRRLTREEANRLEDACQAPHTRLFVSLARHTAARAGAILSLTWRQVDLVRGRIDYGGSTGQKRRSIVPVNPTLASALQEAQRGATSPFVIEYGGKPVKSIKKAFKAAVRRAGLPSDTSPHVLRHSVATWLAEAGRPFEEIAQYLGHTDPRLTYRIYARYSPEHLAKAAAVLE